MKMKKILVNEMIYAIIPSISGEDMKKLIEIRMHDLQEDRSNLLYRGLLDYIEKDKKIKVAYDDNQGVHTEISFYQKGMRIVRSGSVVSDLRFMLGHRSIGTMETPYGTLRLDIETKKYIVTKHTIAMEYELYSAQQNCGAFRFVMKIREVGA